MAHNERYGIGGYDPDHPADNVVERWSNGTQATDPAAGYVAYDDSGKVTEQRPLTDDEQVELDSQDAANTATTVADEPPVTVDQDDYDTLAAAVAKMGSSTTKTAFQALLPILKPS